MPSPAQFFSCPPFLNSIPLPTLSGLIPVWHVPFQTARRQPGYRGGSRREHQEGGGFR
uniref:Uncharacterized protein n=1 Tax=Arundo donax TaxID=35708 RepID=A0A0A9FNF1_ARUDO